MRHTRHLMHITGLLVALGLFLAMGSCGTTRAHIGLDHDVAYHWNGGYYDDAPPRHHKHKKPQKPKKKHHKKSKKHHHHD